ncbi:MAG: septal ring lytic transglycosylase RlpA family protein, partial [Actinomycetota bacterium]|nr:septal ring lytic transglycosylase RlpA family protein [Actinomycetota bacterium]
MRRTSPGDRPDSARSPSRRELSSRALASQEPVEGAGALAEAGDRAAGAGAPELPEVDEEDADLTMTTSYYGYALAGNPTASGETFDPERLTAAHKT